MEKVPFIVTDIAEHLKRKDVESAFPD